MGPIYDIEAIDSRAKAAAPGPWRYFVCGFAPAVQLPHGEAFIASQNGDALAATADFIAYAREDVPALIARVRELEAALAALDAIRNSIVGTQTVNWSAHIYPMVNALEKAGYRGQGYDLARLNAETLIDRLNKLKAENQRLKDRIDKEIGGE